MCQLRWSCHFFQISRKHLPHLLVYLAKELSQSSPWAGLAYLVKTFSQLSERPAKCVSLDGHAIFPKSSETPATFASLFDQGIVQVMFLNLSERPAECVRLDGNDFLSKSSIVSAKLVMTFFQRSCYLPNVSA